MKVKYYFREYPVTMIIIIATILMFFVEIFMGGSESIEVLYNLGALTRESVQFGQWWRLITPIFLHIGFEHIVLNMIAVFVFGIDIEPFLGSWRFLIVYILGGTYGNLVSFAFQSDTTISAGASSSAFALFGVFVLMKRSIVNNSQYKNLSSQIIVLIIFNIVLDLFDNLNGGTISILAHVGGLVGGYFLSIVVGSPKAENYSKMQRLGAALFFIASSIALYTYGMGRGFV